MIVGIPKETFHGERRVPLVATSVSALTKAGLDVIVETAAGESAGFPNTVYEEKGARLVNDRASLFAQAEVVLQIRMAGAAGEVGEADLNLVRDGQVIVGLSEPLIGAASAQALAERGVTAFSMELIPRITRAQSMDALSGIRGLTHPRTAVRGNMLGAARMLLAVVATLLDNQVFGTGAFGFGVIIAGVTLGSLIGATFALKIQMTAMPEMVALLNAFGGGASALVAGAVLVGTESTAQAIVATVASGIIRSVTFTGSLVAFDKLRGLLLPDAPVTFSGQQPLNFLLAFVAL